MSAPLNDLQRSRARLLTTRAARFGEGDSRRLYMGGKVARFGRRIAGAARARDVRLDLDATSFAYAPRLDVAPALVAGALHGPGARTAPLDLVIGLNGRIVATTRAFEVDGTVRFEALIPESELRPGANKVAVYREDAGERLERIPERDR